VRATFVIGADGTLSLADEQVAPKRLAEYAGELGQSSLKYEADLGPLKPHTELTVLGSAYSPRGRPVPSLRASLRLEELSKSIEVFGERVYTSRFLGPDVSAPKPFIQQSICYECAYGGWDAGDSDSATPLRDSRNPIGRGFASDPRTLRGQQAHRQEYPGRAPSKSGPACFGPIPSHWSPRRELAGTYDKQWECQKRPLSPDDYDDRFVVSAPRDQQLDHYLRGGEPLELVNMTPGGVLRLGLPRITISFATRINCRTEIHPGYLVSVIVEPDEARLSLVFQGSLAVHAREADYLDETVVREI
jgi:hypothetical protein